MSYTKREFVTAALEEIGLASFAYDLTDQELLSACKRLDAMIAEWNARGVRLGYPIPSSPAGTNLDSESGVPDSANEAIITNLAVRIAPSYGKVVSPDTKLVAKGAYNTLLQLSAVWPVEKQLPSGMPAGSGNKPWRYDDPFLQDPVDPLEVGGDGVLDFY